MDWLGAALGVAGDLFGQSSALDAQNAMMEKQMQFNREVMQNRHQWEVNDLRSAGLNPLMSVTSPTGTLSAPTPSNVPKMNLAQSAAALSQISINQKMADAAMTNAKAAKIDADANMERAMNDTTRTNFQIGPEFQLRSGITAAQMDNAIANTGLVNSQKLLNDIKIEWEPKLLEANLNEVQNRIAMAKILTAAQDYALRTGADAQMVSANAAAYHASSYERFVANAEMLGVHEAQLTDANINRVNGELENIKQDTERKARENRYQAFNESSTYYRATRHIGDTIDNLLGISKFIH